MAHFASIENGIVSQVIVVNNETLGDLDFPESEAVGQKFIASIGLSGTWKQTSFNKTFRNKFARRGDTYDEVNDEFVAPIVPEIEAPATPE